MSLDQLLSQRPDLWRGKDFSLAAPAGVPTGFAELDALLPGGGWPPGALSEILSPGPGAFALAVPALVRLSAQGRWLLLAGPPLIPYAPALAARGLDLRRLLLVEGTEAEALWAAEQGLRSGACAAVLLWNATAEGATLRRLQLAAASGRALALAFRPAGAARQPSPAILRLGVRPLAGALEVEILKRRGGPGVRPVRLKVR